jgi:hypothetical protein
MLYRNKKSANSRPEHPELESVQKMHRRLAWALGGATGALIVNAVAVVQLVEGG